MGLLNQSEIEKLSIVSKMVFLKEKKGVLLNGTFSPKYIKRHEKVKKLKHVAYKNKINITT